MLNPNRPIIDDFDNREFKIVYSDDIMALGYLVDGKKLYTQDDHDRQFPQHTLLLLNLATGKVRPRWEGDNAGVSLNFRQGPYTYGDTLANSGEGVNVTVEDGKIVRIDVV